MRKTLLVLLSVLTGCATQTNPVYTPPPPKCINIPGEGCKKISAGNVGGTTLGHSDEVEDLPAKAAAVPR